MKTSVAKDRLRLVADHWCRHLLSLSLFLACNLIPRVSPLSLPVPYKVTR